MIIGLGTDGTGDGFGAHQQIAYYARCGFTTAEAIQAATSVERQDSRTHSDGHGGRRQGSRLRRAGCQSP